MASRISNNKSLLSRLSFGDLATWGGKEKSVYENDVMRLLRARNKASVSSPTGVGQLIWPSGALFSKVPITFLAGKLFYVCVCTQDQSFNHFEDGTMKLSVNEVKLTVYLSKELCYYSTSFDFKICLRIRKVIGPLNKRAAGLKTVRGKWKVFGLK